MGGHMLEFIYIYFEWIQQRPKENRLLHTDR